MAALIQRPDYLQAGQRLLSAPLAARWQRKLLDALARYHEQHRDEPGPGRERLRRIALPMEDEALVLLLIEQMRESGLVHSHHGWLHLPEHKAGFTDEQQAVWQKVETLFGDDPWWVRDLAREVHVEESLMRAVLRQAAQQGMITAIVGRSLLPQRSHCAVRPAGARAGSAARFNLRGGFPRYLKRRAEAGDPDPGVFRSDWLHPPSRQRSYPAR